MIEPIGHHDLAAVAACSGARYVATPSDQASRGVPPRCAPHPMWVAHVDVISTARRDEKDLDATARE